jgi:peptidylprolyl isomerase
MRIGAVISCCLSALALGVAGCSDDDGGDGSRAQAGTTTSDATGETDGGYAKEFALPKSREPDIDFPSGPPPTQLQTSDLSEGTGPAVEEGDLVAVNYVGGAWSTKRKYDTSYGANGLPLKVMPGRGDFIDGFEEGLVGMRVGGRRAITIPPDKGYGERGYSGQVKPNETLIFVVDLEKIY